MDSHILTVHSWAELLLFCHARSCHPKSCLPWHRHVIQKRCFFIWDSRADLRHSTNQQQPSLGSQKLQLGPSKLNPRCSEASLTSLQVPQAMWGPCAPCRAEHARAMPLTFPCQHPPRTRRRHQPSENSEICSSWVICCILPGCNNPHSWAPATNR